jgi:hypothetical protein
MTTGNHWEDEMHDRESHAGEHLEERAGSSSDDDNGFDGDTPEDETEHDA